MTLHIEIPGLPPRELSPNARVHWRVRADWTAEYRRSIYLLLRPIMWKSGPDAWATPDHAKVDITFVVPDKRRRDKTNLAASFKAGLDGLVDAGIIKDDSADCCDDQYHIQYEKGVSKVLVEVTGA